MTNANWPRDVFGVNMNLAYPQSKQLVGGASVRVPSMMQLPDDNSGGSVGQTQITVGGTYNIGVNDFSDILLNAPAPITLVLPSSLIRAGIPIGISDIGGYLATYPCEIDPAGAELIMGLASLTLSTPRTGISLYPIATGLGGWYVK